MRILFLTTLNLATNPRIAKEIKLAVTKGHEVSVVLFELGNWSKNVNDVLLNELRGKASVYVIPAGRRPFMPWLFSTLLNKLSHWLLKFSSANPWLLSVYADKRSLLLLRHLKTIKPKADLVIGHNVGTFYPAALFAKKNNIPFGIDLEDYHAGETLHPVNSSRVKELCRVVLPSAAFLTAASSLILEYTLNDLGSYAKKAIVINNVFPVDEFIAPQPASDEKLKLVWFSQNISVGRGLEQIVPALRGLEKKVELYLYGNLDPVFFEAWLKNAKNVTVHPPLPQPDLHKALAHYDAGLAIEPNKDVNNSIAVSNKINAYRQAGLYVIASLTKAQVKWMNETAGAGVLVNLEDQQEVRRTFLNCFESLDEIRLNAVQRFAAAREHSWEAESQKLLGLWQNTAFPKARAEAILSKP